jgi:hypothetical protein
MTLRLAPVAFGVSWSPWRRGARTTPLTGHRACNMDTRRPADCGASARGVKPGHLRLAGRVPKGISSSRCCRLPCRQYQGQPATAFCFLSWHARPAFCSCRPDKCACHTDRGITGVPVGGIGSPVRRECGRCCLAMRLAWGVLGGATRSPTAASGGLDGNQARIGEISDLDPYKFMV